jgi:hypothetical protein
MVKILIGIIICLSLNLVAETKKPFAMDCSSVYYNPGFFIERCENKEVICYSYSEGGLECKFKTKGENK